MVAFRADSDKEGNSLEYLGFFLWLGSCLRFRGGCPGSSYNSQLPTLACFVTAMADLDLNRLRLNRGPAAPAPRSRRRLWLLAGTVLVLGGLGLGGLLQRQTEVEVVSITTAYPYQGVTLLNAAGYVVASRKAAVASKATGRLEWLGVLEGSWVKAGEVLARLENRDMQAQADQAAASVVSAQAELKDASRGLERAKDLAERKFISGSSLDAAQARYDKARAGVGVAQAALRAAQVAVEQTLIRAPFDGVVLTKTANVGDVITPFSSALDSKGAVVTMADMETLEVEADVAEANLAKIQVGQPCEIQLDAFPDKRFRGEVSRLVPTVDRSKATVLTKVRFIDRDERILPEMSAKVAFLEKALAPDQRQPLTAVHKDALVTRDGKGALFLVRDGRAQWLPVTPGRAINDLVEVSGQDPAGAALLVPGAKVVARPPEGLKDGARVKVVQK